MLGRFSGERKGYPLQYSGLENSMDLFIVWGFSDSSVNKESTCNAGHRDSIPGSGGSAGEGIGYPLQYSWASHVAQLVKNLPAMQETWLRSLGWEDPLEKGKATHSSILAWRIPWTLESQSPTRLSDFHFHPNHDGGIYLWVFFGASVPASDGHWMLIALPASGSLWGLGPSCLHSCTSPYS